MVSKPQKTHAQSHVLFFNFFQIKQLINKHYLSWVQVPPLQPESALCFITRALSLFLTKSTSPEYYFNHYFLSPKSPMSLSKNNSKRSPRAVSRWIKVKVEKWWGPVPHHFFITILENFLFTNYGCHIHTFLLLISDSTLCL